MEAILVKPFFETRASQGYARMTMPPVNSDKGIPPPTNYYLLEKMVRNDEVLSTAMDTTVDMVSRNGYDFTTPITSQKTNVRTLKKAQDIFLELDFPGILDNIVYSMTMYGDCFLELVKDNQNKITEVHVLETLTMTIDYDKHGTIKGYVQYPRRVNMGVGINEAPVLFKPDEVIHFAMKKVGSSVYSFSPLQPVAAIWANKVEANSYLLQSFRNLPPELLIHLKGADKNMASEFRGMLQRRKQEAGYIPVTRGSGDSGLQVEQIVFQPDGGMLKILEYLRECVLMITRVPPVWVGIVNNDGANRSNSEAQIFSFETRIRKIQQKIQDKLNTELMPFMDLGNLLFSFNPISIRDEKAVVETAASLHSIGASPKNLLKFLERNGISDFDKDDFKSMSEFNQTAANMNSPSRIGSDGKNVNSEVDSSGVSEKGRVKTEEKNDKVR